MIDSSMSSVPSTRTEKSQAAASPSRSGLPVWATWPVIPTPTRVARRSSADSFGAVSSPWNAIGTRSSPRRRKTRQLW